MSKRTNRFLFLITWLALGQPLVLPAQSPGNAQERIRQVETGLVPPIRFRTDTLWHLRERMEHYRVPGMSIAVIENFKIAWVKSYGVKDLESKEPVTNQTLFQAASISKPVSAYAALREVEKGSMALEEDVNRYLTAWRLAENEFTKAEKVTLKYLLSHRAGVTVHGFAGYAAGEKVPTLLQVLNGEPPANSAAVRVDRRPGSGFRYAGGGYCVVQQMLTEAQQKPFPAVMEALVLKPLDMHNSTFAQPLPESKRKLAASGHLPDGTAVPGKRHVYPELAAAGLWTTAEDLAKFVVDVELSLQGKSNKVLSKATANQMLTPFGEAYTGLGIFLDNKKEDVYFQHGGWNAGFSSHLVGHKEKGYGVVVLANGNQPLLVNEVIRAVAAAYRWDNYMLPVFTRLPLSAGDIEQASGRYGYEAFERINVFGRDNRLFYQLGTEPPEELFKVADNTFMRREWEHKITFAVNPADNKRHLVFTVGEEPVSYKHPLLEAAQKVPYEWLWEGQFEKALSAYRQLQKQQADHFAVQEGYLNKMGYQLLDQKDFQRAIDIFRINTLLYPDRSNTFDSLAEAYMRRGDKQLAREHYQQAIKLDPDNGNAIKMLKKLNGE